MRDTLDLDILIVGGGPAGLSAALRLAQLQRERGGDPLSIAVVDKARDAGAHELSGAVLDPSALARLVPDFTAKGAPLASEVRRDDVYLLTRQRGFRFPVTPPPLRNHGHYVISISRFVKWLSAEVESAGVDVFQGFSASEVLYDGARVIGARLGDRGLDRQGGQQKAFEPGAEVRAKVTIFCDGVRGNLTKTVVDRLKLDEGRLPQVYALGIKELWEVPPDRVPAGTVIHTLGYPLRAREFGGAFLYGLPGGAVSLGLVCGLDYEDPRFDPYARFQRLKAHPFVSRLLEGGTRVRYGAKALPEGGWHAIPRLHMDGALIAGDAGGFLNSLRLKGIHLAMRTGMLAAEAAFDAVRAADVSAARLASYSRAIETGDVKRELFPVRNVHQAFSHGLVSGMVFAGLSLVTGGWWFRDRLPAEAGHARMRRLETMGAPPDVDGAVVADRRLTFDRLTSVHFSGTHHREDQPSHLRVHDTDICRTRCRVEYGNPCTRFCPASVYEMVDDGAGGARLQVHAANCVHCKTCDIMDPYQIIDWVPPEGGDGPQYQRHVKVSDERMDSTGRLRGVLVGAGYFSQFHLDAWARVSDAALVAICDEVEDRARAAGWAHGIANVYQDAATMLARERPDFIDIVTPPASHRELCRLAGETGVHVLCQKALAPTFAEAEALVADAERAGIRLMVHDNFRFQPWHRELRKLLDAGAIGRLHSIGCRTRLGDGWGADAYRSRQPYFRTMPQLLIFETGVHFIDVYRYLAGEVTQVFARLRRLNPAIAGEDSGVVTFEFESGAAGLWDANRYNESLSRDPRYTFGEFLLDGEGGSLRVDEEGAISVQTLGSLGHDHPYAHTRLGFSGDSCHAAIAHFVANLRSGAPFETEGRAYLRTLAVQEAVYASAAQNRPVDVVQAVRGQGRSV